MTNNRSPLRFVLASGSPARLATLRAAGIEPEVIVSGVDEDDVESTAAPDFALELARRKATAVVAELAQTPDNTTLVLGCDSVLEFGGQILGKPGTFDTAVRRWREMRGGSGVLHTGHCLIDLTKGRSAEHTASTVVHFADLTDAEVDAYVATGEPLDVAGGFKIDGLGGAFVDGIEGDPHNVVGISLPLLRTMFSELDVFWPALWTTNGSTVG